jgi:modulator of FtsH protease
MYGAVAAAAAAFAGLLFVALTTNLPRILPDAAHVARAREALWGLLSLVVMALLVLIPGQARGALGLELLVLAAILTVASVRYQRQTRRGLPAERRGRWMARMLPVNAGTAAMAVAGASLVAGAGGGLYWLAATTVIYVLRSAMDAWALVVEAADTAPGA